MDLHKHSQINEKNNRTKILEDMATNRLYDSKEAIEILGISLQSLRRAIAIGKIKTVRVGRMLRIPADEIKKLVQGEAALLNVSEAAHILNVGIFTIRTLINTGKIKAFRLANHGPFKIPKSEIERIAKEGESL